MVRDSLSGLSLGRRMFESMAGGKGSGPKEGGSPDPVPVQRGIQSDNTYEQQSRHVARCTANRTCIPPVFIYRPCAAKYTLTKASSRGRRKVYNVEPRCPRECRRPLQSSHFAFGHATEGSLQVMVTPL